MSNALFDKGREAFLGGSINWINDTIKVALVDHAIHTPSPTTDTHLADITSDARVATSPPLTNKTITGGVADADDVTVTEVSGPTVGSYVIYKDMGSDDTSRLIAYIDTATGLPFIPNGGDLTIAWDAGPNRIFKL